MARTEDIPKGFVSLLDASGRLGELLNVMGVVTDVLPAAKSRGTDYMSKFTLYDPSSGDFDVKFFRPSLDELPQVSVGDVAVIYSIKVTVYRGVRIALSSYQTAWTVFAAHDIPSKGSSGTTKIRHTSSAGTRPPAAAVSLYAISLCNSRGRPDDGARSEPANRAVVHGAAAPAPVSVVSASRACLIKDVKEQKFCDVVGQVVKTYPGERGTLEIYITDYTSHELLFNYECDDSGGTGGVSRDGDAYGYVPSRRVNRSWPGPYGQMTLQVTLWPPHADHAQEHVKVGDNVYLRNLAIKRVRESLLAAVLHTNRIRPDRIDVHVIDDPSDSRVKDLLVRKRAYWKKIEKDRKKSLQPAKDTAKNPEAPKQKQQQKRQREVDENTEEVEREVKAKKAKNKGRKPAKRKGEALPEAQPEPPQHNGMTDLNKHIRCNHPAKRPIPIAEILRGNGHEVTSPKGVNYALPFHNVCCRTRARVVDFFPHDLADFAVPYKPSEYDVLTESSESNGNSGSDTDDAHSGWDARQDSEVASSIRWEWRFYLLLEDGWAKPGSANGTDKDKLQVLVAQEDAEYLLKLTAEDLRKNPTALDTLRERLFILWGDLEERKAAARALQDNPQPRSKQSKAPNDGGDGDKSGGVPSGKAFECCLKEYGVRAPKQTQNEGSETDDIGSFGWDRRFRMFGTTIM